MGGQRGAGWARTAALAVALAIAAPGAVSLAQKSVAPPATQPAPADPFSIPPDVRAEKAAETARSESLLAQAENLQSRGDYRAAEQSWREMVALLEATWGPRHPVTGFGLSNLALNLGLVATLDSQGRYPDAEPLLRRALSIFETRLGADHPATATAVKNLAANLISQGRYADAEPLFRRALSIDEARLGPNDPGTASILSILASILDSQGRYGDAEPLLRRALAIREAGLGADHPGTAFGINALALNLYRQGRYADAEPLLRRALSINEARLGQNDIGTARTLNDLAVNLTGQGRYADAEPLLRRALSIAEAPLGTDRSRAAASLNNLAVNLDYQGRYVEAEPLLRRALSIDEARLGPDHPETTARLINLAANLNGQGRYADAEPLLRRALPITEARLGADHPDVASGLNNLALNLFSQGRYADAEPLYRRALSIREARLGANHPDTALSIRALALNLSHQGRSAVAEPLLRRALAITEARLGPDHPETALSAEFLAVVELKLSHFEMALSHARTALQGRERLRTDAKLTTVEGTRAQLLSASGDTGMLFSRAAWSMVTKKPARASALRAEAFEALTIRASSSADALAQGAARIAAERVGASPIVAAWGGAQDRLAALDAQIAQAAGQGAAGDAQRSKFGAERATAAAELVAAERDLSARFPRYFDLLKVVPLSVADLQAPAGDNARLLGADEALIVFTPGHAGMPEGQRKGLVFVVTKETAAWAEIPLEPDALAAEIAALHATLADPRAGATLAPGIAAPTVLYDRTRAFALYRTLFGAPETQAALAGKRRWLIAPQGPLMSLPFAALPIGTPPGGAAADADPTALRATQWLGTERTLAILPSVSALRVQRLYPLERARTERTPFFGLGDPAFRGVADGDVRGGGALLAARSYFRGGVADLATFSRLPRLPNTAREIRTLASNLGAGADSYVLQLDATEAELRRRNATSALGRAEIIAFATHGLVAGEFQNSIAEPALALTPPALAAGVQLTADNDGLLTASEAATLTLSARFVILSACNTASGDKPDADALSGLARAFFYAGAQSLLVSHYPVFDDAAMRLTTEAARLSRGGAMRNPEAMQASMRALMMDTSADANGYSYAHPKAWAPFAVIDAN